jgi:hypothetical protein
MGCAGTPEGGMSPVCAKCQVVMRIKKTGADVEEMSGPEIPYRIWSADVFSCSSCGAEVITGFGTTPMAEHYQPKYEKFKKNVTYRFWELLTQVQH